METLTRTNQSIACLFHVSFSVLFTPLTMNMKNMLVVVMQCRGYLYVLLLGGVCGALTARDTCAHTECLFLSKCEPEVILFNDRRCLDDF